MFCLEDRELKNTETPPPHPRQQNKIRCLTSATKSDASHLPILLHDGDKKMRAAWEATSPKGESQGNDERTGEGPLAPQCQRCPSRSEENINTAYATSPQR